MKAVKQIDEELKALEDERIQLYIDKEKKNNQLSKKQKHLNQQKQRALERFENKIKKMFGVVKVTVKHNQHLIRIEDNKGTMLFDYDCEDICYERIGVENGMKIKEMYEEVYGYPQEEEIETITVSNYRTIFGGNE
jgi:hypothetical protein